ncbi:MAG: formate/nitrite transporter family protein [Muribaculaceae bacterium]|nr:formate/nitrite transporter family protein [Muribaculaceae bacterium]
MTVKDCFRSVIAGICIGIAATVYLNVGGLAGSILFSFGLIAVVSLQLLLFTGISYMVWGSGYGRLLVILVFNLLGCLLVAAVTSTPELTACAEGIISKRLTQGPLKCGLLAIGCGFIMTTAVTQAKATPRNWLPLLLGVPVFIQCGFPHCIADAFYLEACSVDYLRENIMEIVCFYVSIVLGNYAGCNLYRLTGQNFIEIAG